MEQLNKGIFEQLKEERKNKAGGELTLPGRNILFTTFPHKELDPCKKIILHFHNCCFSPFVYN